MAETDPKQLITMEQMEQLFKLFQQKHNPRNYITRTEIGRKTNLPKLHNLV